MNRSYIAAILLILSFIFSFPLSGQERRPEVRSDMRDSVFLETMKRNFIEINGDLLIEEIVVTGNRKTRRSVITNSTGVVPGTTRLSEFNPNSVTNRLRAYGIFVSIKIRYMKDQDRVIIGIHVREKITLLPIPMYSDNGHTQTIGLFLIENNLLGFNKKLFAGITWSEISTFFMIGYVDPFFLQTDFNYSLFFRYLNSETETGNSDEEIFQKYKQENISAKFEAGYYVSRGTNLKLATEYRDVKIFDDFSDGYNEPGSVTAAGYGGRIVIKRLRYNEYLNFGLKTDLKILYYSVLENDQERSDDKDGFAAGEFRGEYSMKLFDEQKLRLFISAGGGNKPESFRKRIGGKEGFLTLPADIISADEYASSTLSYEVPLDRYSFGFLTGFVFWEQGRYAYDNDNIEDFYGPGAGLRLYLRRVAFPAMSLNYAHNMENGYSQLIFTIGFSF